MQQVETCQNQTKTNISSVFMTFLSFEWLFIEFIFFFIITVGLNVFKKLLFTLVQRFLKCFPWNMTEMRRRPYLKNWFKIWEHRLNTWSKMQTGWTKVKIIKTTCHLTRIWSCQPFNFSWKCYSFENQMNETGKPWRNKSTVNDLTKLHFTIFPVKLTVTN